MPRKGFHFQPTYIRIGIQLERGRESDEWKMVFDDLQILTFNIRREFTRFRSNLFRNEGKNKKINNISKINRLFEWNLGILFYVFLIAELKFSIIIVNNWCGICRKINSKCTYLKKCITVGKLWWNSFYFCFTSTQSLKIDDTLWSFLRTKKLSYVKKIFFLFCVSNENNTFLNIWFIIFVPRNPSTTETNFIKLNICFWLILYFVSFKICQFRIIISV